MWRYIMGAVFLLWGLSAIAGKQYTAEQLHQMIAAKNYPKTKTEVTVYEGKIGSVIACKQRLLNQTSALADFPVLIVVDIATQTYEGSIWLSDKKQRVVCENKMNKVVVTQFEAQYE